MKEPNPEIEKYFRMLHPNFDQLSAEDQWFANYDMDFLTSNFYEIDSKFLRASLSQIPGEKKKAPTEILKMVVAGVRSEKNFEVLHPEYEQLPDAEKWKALDDKELLFNYDAEINREYYRLRGEAKYMRGEEPNAPECMKHAVENVKQRRAQRNTKPVIEEQSTDAEGDSKTQIIVT